MCEGLIALDKAARPIINVAIDPDIRAVRGVIHLPRLARRQIAILNISLAAALLRYPV